MFNPSFYHLRLQTGHAVQDITVGTDWTAVPPFAGSPPPVPLLQGRILTELTDLRAGPDDFGLQYHDGQSRQPDTYLPLSRMTPAVPDPDQTWLAAAPLSDPLLSRLCEQMPCTLDYHGTGRIAHVALHPGAVTGPCWRISIECLGHDRYRCAAPWAGDGWSFELAARSRTEAFFLAASLHPDAAHPHSAFRRLFPDAPPQPASGEEFRQRQPAALESFFRAHGPMLPPVAAEPIPSNPPVPPVPPVVPAGPPSGASCAVQPPAALARATVRRAAMPAVAAEPATAPTSRSLREIVSPLLDQWQFAHGAINLYVLYYSGRGINRNSLNSVIGKMLKRMLKANPDRIFPRTWSAVFRQVDIEALAGVCLTDRAAVDVAYAKADRRLLTLRPRYYRYGGQDWSGFFNAYAVERRARLTAGTADPLETPRTTDMPASPAPASAGSGRSADI